MTHRIFTRDATVMPRRPRDGCTRPSPAARGRGFGPAGRLPEIDPVGGRAVSFDPLVRVEPRRVEKPAAILCGRPPLCRPGEKPPTRSEDAAPAMRWRDRVAPRTGPASGLHRGRGPPEQHVRHHGTVPPPPSSLEAGPTHGKEGSPCRPKARSAARHLASVWSRPRPHRRPLHRQRRARARRRARASTSGSPPPTTPAAATSPAACSSRPPSPSAAAGGRRPELTVDENTRYQQFEGGGASFTDTAAWLMNSSGALSRATRDAGHAEALRPATRVSASASSATRWAPPTSPASATPYDDMPAGQTDPTSAHFSIAHDLADVLPLTKQARQLNPGRQGHGLALERARPG